MKKRKNTYLIAGGGGRKDENFFPVFKMILAEPEKKKPYIAYTGTANGDDSSFFKFLKDSITSAGECDLVHVNLSKKNADPETAKLEFKKADIIFVSGGDVYQGMEGLNRHTLVPFLKDLYENGTLFFGISAGSIMLGNRWVNWDDPDDDSTAGIFECIGIVPLLCDTHAEADKWEELKTAVGLLNEQECGYGIPSGGTIIVSPDGSFSAVGKPSVVYENREGKAVKTGELQIKK